MNEEEKRKGFAVGESVLFERERQRVWQLRVAAAIRSFKVLVPIPEKDIKMFVQKEDKGRKEGCCSCCWDMDTHSGMHMLDQHSS